MHRFFCGSISENIAILDEQESQHCIKVLRLGRGDQVELCDGKGHVALGRLAKDHPKKAEIEILNIEQFEKPKPGLHLAIAPTKNQDRLEWMLEKSVEIGLTKLTLLLTERTEKRKANMERLQKIVTSALKQSAQTWACALVEPVRFDQFLTLDQSVQRFIAHVADPRPEHFFQKLQTRLDALIMIGPEGDFTQNEVKMALQNGFVPVGLGKSVLRTETAGLYAVTAFNLKNA
jgi:16S rRNA (uracil1498-N3)-methyltransferase